MSQSKVKDYCKKFLKFGECMYGDNCPHKHDQNLCSEVSSLITGKIYLNKGKKIKMTDISLKPTKKTDEVKLPSSIVVVVNKKADDHKVASKILKNPTPKFERFDKSMKNIKNYDKKNYENPVDEYELKYYDMGYKRKLKSISPNNVNYNRHGNYLPPPTADMDNEKSYRYPSKSLYPNVPSSAGNNSYYTTSSNMLNQQPLTDRSDRRDFYDSDSGGLYPRNHHHNQNYQDPYLMSEEYTFRSSGNYTPSPRLASSGGEWHRGPSSSKSTPRQVDYGADGYGMVYETQRQNFSARGRKLSNYGNNKKSFVKRFITNKTGSSLMPSPNSPRPSTSAAKPRATNQRYNNTKSANYAKRNAVGNKTLPTAKYYLNKYQKGGTGMVKATKLNNPPLSDKPSSRQIVAQNVSKNERSDKHAVKKLKMTKKTRSSSSKQSLESKISNTTTRSKQLGQLGFSNPLLDRIDKGHARSTPTSNLNINPNLSHSLNKQSLGLGRFNAPKVIISRCVLPVNKESLQKSSPKSTSNLISSDNLTPKLLPPLSPTLSQEILKLLSTPLQPNSTTKSEPVHKSTGLTGKTALSSITKTPNLDSVKEIIKKNIAITELIAAAQKKIQEQQKQQTTNEISTPKTLSNSKDSNDSKNSSSQEMLLTKSSQSSTSATTVTAASESVTDQDHSLEDLERRRQLLIMELQKEQIPEEIDINGTTYKEINYSIANFKSTFKELKHMHQTLKMDRGVEDAKGTAMFVANEATLKTTDSNGPVSENYKTQIEDLTKAFNVKENENSKDLLFHNDFSSLSEDSSLELPPNNEKLESLPQKSAITKNKKPVAQSNSESKSRSVATSFFEKTNESSTSYDTDSVEEIYVVGQKFKKTTKTTSAAGRPSKSLKLRQRAAASRSLSSSNSNTTNTSTTNSSTGYSSPASSSAVSDGTAVSGSSSSESESAKIYPVPHTSTYPLDVQIKVTAPKKTTSEVEEGECLSSTTSSASSPNLSGNKERSTPGSKKVTKVFKKAKKLLNPITSETLVASHSDNSICNKDELRQSKDRSLEQGQEPISNCAVDSIQQTSLAVKRKLSDVSNETAESTNTKIQKISKPSNNEIPITTYSSSIVALINHDVPLIVEEKLVKPVGTSNNEMDLLKGGEEVKSEIIKPMKPNTQNKSIDSDINDEKLSIPLKKKDYTQRELNELIFPNLYTQINGDNEPIDISKIYTNTQKKDLEKNVRPKEDINLATNPALRLVQSLGISKNLVGQERFQQIEKMIHFGSTQLTTEQIKDKTDYPYFKHPVALLHAFYESKMSFEDVCSDVVDMTCGISNTKDSFLNSKTDPVKYLEHSLSVYSPAIQGRLNSLIRRKKSMF